MSTTDVVDTEAQPSMQNGTAKNDENENDTGSIAIDVDDVDGDAEQVRDECTSANGCSGASSKQRGGRRKRTATGTTVPCNENASESGETEKKRLRYSLRARAEPALNPQLAEFILHQPTGCDADITAERRSDADASQLASAADLASTRTSMRGRSTNRVRDSIPATQATESSGTGNEPQEAASNVNIPDQASKSHPEADVVGQKTTDSKSGKRRSQSRRSVKNELVENEDFTSANGRKRNRKSVKTSVACDDRTALRRFAFRGQKIRDLLPAKLVREWHTRSAISEAQRVLRELQSASLATNAPQVSSNIPVGQKLNEIADWLIRNQVKVECTEAAECLTLLTDSAAKLQTEAAARLRNSEYIKTTNVMERNSADFTIPGVVIWPALPKRAGCTQDRLEADRCGLKRTNAASMSERELRSEMLISERAFLEAFGVHAHRDADAELESFSLVEHNVKIWPVRKQPDAAASGKSDSKRKSYKRKSHH